MGNRSDFLNCLGLDMSRKILMRFDDPSDLVRVSCVSQSWRHHVIANGLCKQLCLRMFPQLSKVDHVVEPSSSLEKPAEGASENFAEAQSSESEHRVYTFLARAIASFPVRDLILEPIYASSTDNYPVEGIHNTLEPNDRVAGTASYWSSKGHNNPDVPETLIYKLAGDPCVISEINIQPFEAFFQLRLPIYSARAVRFQMGHAKSPIDDPMGDLSNDSVDDKFVWTYTSREFPMAQNFKLPEPVMCIGGILKIELLGRVQIQETDGLYYICVAHVQIMGRLLSPAFGVDILEPSGKFVLKGRKRSGTDYNVLDTAEYELLEEDDSDDEFVL